MSMIMLVVGLLFGIQYWYFGNVLAGVFALLFLFSAISLRKDRNVI